MPNAVPRTRQYTAFAANISYARDMINAGQSLAGLQPGALDVGDLYRAAWVQAVSALDHWAHEELYVRVAALAADTGPGMPQNLQRFELPLAVIEQVRLDTLPIAEAVSTRVKEKWHFVSLQSPQKITEAMKLVTDQDLWALAATKINEWHSGPEIIGPGTIKKNLEDVVYRRNRIAHSADLVDGELKLREPIDSGAVTNAVDWIDRIVRAMAIVLG